jgi:pyruvate dehydrogenase (quinone)/pyruvate oxidase
LQALIPYLERKDKRRFLETAQRGMADWWKKMEEQATRRDTPMKPQVVAWELGKRLKDDAIFASDSGTIATWYARHIKVRRNQLCTLSGNLATMANGFPYAIAAQIAYPERQVVAFVGDGGFTMLMGEFATCVKYKLPVKVVIVKNNVLGQIKWEQMVFLGNPEYGCELQPIDFAAFARACGGDGFTIEDPARCGEILDAALATPGPAIIEAVVDPHEPPMPPRITMKQAEHFAEALAKGTPHGGRIALTAVSDKIREIV